MTVLQTQGGLPQVALRVALIQVQHRPQVQLSKSNSKETTGWLPNKTTSVHRAWKINFPEPAWARIHQGETARDYDPKSAI